MAWLPHSIAEASTEAPAGGDVGLPAAWSHLMRPAQRCRADRRIRCRKPKSGRSRGGNAASAGAAGHWYRRGVAIRSRSDSARPARQHQRHPHLGDGMSGLSVHPRDDAWWGELSTVRQPGHRKVCRAADDEWHRLHRECFGRRAGHRRRRQLRGGVVRRRTRRQLDADRRCPSDADRSALLLRLGHRDAVVLAHRTDRRSGAA